MAVFTVPTRDQVSENNQAIFDNLQKGLGFVPNIYATLAYSNTALEDYLGFQNIKSSLSTREKEVVSLVVSEVNGCSYCLAAHTAISKMNKFSEEEIIEIRGGELSTDAKLGVLAAFVKETSVNRGKPSVSATDELIEAGYSKENIVDIVIAIGAITITNTIHGITGVPVDFPAAVSLEAVAV